MYVFAELFEGSFARSKEKPGGHWGPTDPIYGYHGEILNTKTVFSLQVLVAFIKNLINH